MKIFLWIIFFNIFFCENTFTQNWMPLEVGNTIQYTLKYYYQFPSSPPYQNYYFKKLIVTDSTIINNKKYFSINGFFGFDNGTLVRYDNDSLKVLLLIGGIEYVYMDFSLPSGSVLSQIQPNNTFKPITIANSSTIIMDSTVNLKGFIREATYPDRYKKGWYYFGDNLGPTYQYENSNWLSVWLESFKMIEYLLYDSLENSMHKKHSFSADIQFIPILFLPSTTNLVQDFKVFHPLSVYTGLFELGRTYIDNVYLESYYSNDVDTIYNASFTIIPTSEMDYSLDYPIDTLKYNEGYFLHYRIVAKDKGILPSYYYKPDSGYYKLFLGDSTTSSISENNLIPKEHKLFQNYPNPFNPNTNIQYGISDRQFVTLIVYDVLGKEIATLVNEEKPAGNYEIEFYPESSIKNPASGVYFYQLRAGDYVETKKMILLK